MHKITQELASCIELREWMGWGAPGALRCAPVAATFAHFFCSWAKNINDVGHGNAAEMAKTNPVVQDLAHFSRNIIWTSHCAEISAGCAPVATGSKSPRGAETKKLPFSNLEHQVSGSDVQNNSGTCVPCRIEGWGGLGLIGCPQLCTGSHTQSTIF